MSAFNLVDHHIEWVPMNEFRAAERTTWESDITTSEISNKTRIQEDSVYSFTDHDVRATLEEPTQTTAAPRENTIASSFGWLTAFASSPTRWPVTLFVVWSTGCLISLATLAAAWFDLRRRLSQYSVSSDKRLLRILDQACVRWRCRTRSQILIANETISPFVVGVLRPRIVLSPLVASDMSDDEVRCILAHELAHVRRQDILIQWITLGVRAIYWFHPCVWLVSKHMRVCREAACDDRVASNLSVDQREQYGLAILRLVNDSKPLRLGSCLCGLFGVKNSIRSRIQRLATAPRSSPIGSLFSLVFILFAAIVGFTDSVVGVQTGAVTERNAANQNGAGRQPDDEKKSEVASTLTIAGTCVSWEGNTPLPGVAMTMFEARGPNEEIRELQTITTDQEGRYSFSGIPSTDQSRATRRQYFLRAVAEGHPDVLFPIAQDFDTTGRGYDIRMHQGTGAIKGKVTDEKGMAVVGATVERLNFAPANKVGFPSTTTNKDGLFILTGMPLIDGKPSSSPNAYIQIHHPEFSRRIFTRKSLDYSVFELERGCIFEGVVVDAESGKPLEGLTFTTQLADTEFDGRGGNATTDSNGRFRVVLDEGNYNLILDDANYVAKSGYLECRNGRTLKLDPIQATAGGWIVGLVFNTDTNLPMVFDDEPGGLHRRIGVGLYGPDRLVGKLQHTHCLDEVDDEGRFRMRALPGENFPYLSHLRGERTQFNTLKQPPVIVEAGKETTYNLTFRPPRTPEQKMEKARAVLNKLPEGQDERIDGIISELRKLNHTVDECEIWCLLLQHLTQIGKPAVPAICSELEATESSNMMRRLAFVLRAIGDPRAVPALIRVLPKTLQPPMSDYGLIVDNPELTQFMQAHDLDADGANNLFGYRRPIGEVYGSLNKLTQRSEGEGELIRMFKSKDLRLLARQEKRFDDEARKWATWWETNWQQFGVGQEYSQVNLPKFEPRNLSSYPTGLELNANATLDYGWQNRPTLAPIGSDEAQARYFFDLDNGRDFGWPKKLPAKDASEEVIQESRKFSAEKGYDLICISQTDARGNDSYVLFGIDLQLWEIDTEDARKIEDFVKAGKLPKGRKLDNAFLLHRDSQSLKDSSSIGSSFLYVTKEEGIGVITIDDFVNQPVKASGGLVMTPPKGVGPHRGVRVKYQPIAR